MQSGKSESASTGAGDAGIRDDAGDTVTGPVLPDDLAAAIADAADWDNAHALIRDARTKLGDPALVAVLRAASNRFPDNPGPSFQLARHLLRMEDVEGADAAHADACERGLPRGQSELFLVARHWTARDWDALASLTPRPVAHAGPTRTSPWLRIAFARLVSGDLLGGVKAATLHAELNPGPAEYVTLLTRWLIDAGEPGVARSALDKVARREPGLPELEIALHALDVFAPLPAASRQAEAGLTKTAAAPEAAAARDWMLKVTRQNQLSPEERPSPAALALLEQALLSALRERYADAIEGLDLFLGKTWPADINPRSREIRDLLAVLAEAPAPKRALLQDEHGELLVSPPDPSGNIALVFAGLADKAAGLPVQFLDGILARQGFQTIILRDYSRCAFTCGIRSLAPTARETVSILRARLRKEGRKRLVTIGLSGGGYASLRYGIALEADTLYSFSGGTVATPADMAALGDERVPVVARLAERRATESDFMSPVRDVLAETGVCPTIELYFGENAAIDRRHAEDLASFDGVHLNPVPDHHRHDILSTLLSQGFTFTPSRPLEPAQ